MILLEQTIPQTPSVGEFASSHQESLPLRLYNVSYLSELICFEIMFSNKFFNFKSLYISPSQSSDTLRTLSITLI